MRYVIILFVGLLVCPLLPAGQQVKKITPKVSHPAANYGKYNFKLTTLDGKTVFLSDYAGKVILVSIWAPWCGPCKKEAPGFVNLYKEYKNKGFEILGVAAQTNESDVRSFIEEYKTPWPVGINDEVAKNYGTYGLPDNYLFKTDGSLMKHFVGFTQENVLKPLVEEAIKQVAVVKSK
jgi:thiol-disulfide isomerase/thioredoxin